MSRWECESGHILEGLFYNQSIEEANCGKMPFSVTCPHCGYEMMLSREEGTKELLRRVREFVHQTLQDPHYVTSASSVLRDLLKLETLVRKLADDAMRP